MEFIHSDNELHNPVDMSRVEHLKKTEYNTVFKIQFMFNQGYCIWDFPSKKERDEAHSKILIAINSQNISTLITL